MFSIDIRDLFLTLIDLSLFFLFLNIWNSSIKRN